MDKDKQINELISIALWSIRRIPTKHLKHYALTELRNVIDKEHEHSDFIYKCLAEVILEG